MATKREVLRSLFEKYVKGTRSEAVITDKTVFFCHLTNEVSKVLDVAESSVYARTIPLKHMYDKRPAEEFDFIVDHIHKVVKYPDDIYKNKSPKRGTFCFVKSIQDEKYLCSLEIMEKNEGKIMIVTAFRIRKDNYLDSYDLLWSWRGDNPSS